MARLRSACAMVLLLTAAVACRSDLDKLDERLLARIDASEAEVLGLYFRNLESPDSLLINPDVRMHAASTMKVPVMIQLFRDADAGIIGLDEPITVKNTFLSIVDVSPYEVTRESDSDSAIYDWIGRDVPMHELVDRMITVSSNLATNIVIERADAARVTATMRSFGADSIEVLRGVEDIAAYRAGLSNTTTARDLGVIFVALAEGRAASEDATRQMLNILESQHFTENIPAGLPRGTRVANKTGWITAINHDAAIVYPEAGPKYVLVVLVRGLEDHKESAELIADLSRMVYAYVVRTE